MNPDTDLRPLAKVLHEAERQEDGDCSLAYAVLWAALREERMWAPAPADPQPAKDTP